MVKNKPHNWGLTLTASPAKCQMIICSSTGREANCGNVVAGVGSMIVVAMFRRWKSFPVMNVRG